MGRRRSACSARRFAEGTSGARGDTTSQQTLPPLRAIWPRVTVVRRSDRPPQQTTV